MRKISQAIQQPSVAEPLGYCLAIVKSVAAATATICEIEVGGKTYPAAIATHIPYIVPGQQVAALDVGGHAGWLITAAWPATDRPIEAPFAFDPVTGTLRIQATRLNLSAIANIELSCGAARLCLSMDGKAHIEGKEVLSAAIGPNRIEGASIDLN
jgi:hypothetical protein